MSMTTDQSIKLAELKASYLAFERLSRSPKRITPSAPWIIPVLMVIVCTFALICLAIKLIMNYLKSRNHKSRTFGRPNAHSPDIPTTPDQDQASMATTASMKTRGGSLRLHRQHKTSSKPPPVSLYQLKQKQSPGSSSKSKTHRAAMKAMSRAARSEANRSRESNRQTDEGSDENSNNIADNSPNLSLDDAEDLQVGNQSGLIYGAASARPDVTDGMDLAGHSSSVNQPEVHIVQIRDLEEANLQHSQPTWSKTESDI